MTDVLLVSRTLRAGYPYLFGGILGALGDGRYKPNLPDGVFKAIANGGLNVQISPHAQVLAHVEAATRASVQIFVEADQLGTDVSGIVRDYLDECGNRPWPLWKWPKPWWLLPLPGQVDGGENPEPSPWLTQQMRIVVALTLTDLGDQLDTDLGTTLVDGAAQLFDIATSATITNGR